MSLEDSLSPNNTVYVSRKQFMYLQSTVYFPIVHFCPKSTVYVPRVQFKSTEYSLCPKGAVY